MLITVYASCADEVIKRLDKLARKAKEYNIKFGYTKGDEYTKAIDIYKVDPADGRTQYRADTRYISAVDFNIDCDGFIKANGWEVCARVEHGDIGNIVTPINDKPILSEWYSAPAKCEHCNTNHNRKITYFVRHESGVIRQVGRACLHDYTGINPALAALWASARDLFPQDLNTCDGDEIIAGGHSDYMYPVINVLANAIESIKENGYRKSGDAKSTKQDILERFNNKIEASAESIKKAESINEWLINDCNSDTTNNIEHNCHILAVSKFAKLKHLGLLAYMPVAYNRYLEKQNEAKKSPSMYIGEIGERLTVDVNQAELLTSWETIYGKTYLYKFTDNSGNVLVWFGSKIIELSENMKIKATVKDHNERDGIKQTIITRCKVSK